MRKVELGKVLQLHRGYDLPYAKRVSGTVPVISSSGISGSHNAAKCTGPNVITGRYGTIGEVYYHDGACWPLNTTLYVSDFKGNDPKYVYYLLRYALKELMFGDGSDKSTVPGVDRNVLHMLRVPFEPDFERQKMIAGTLSNIDAKIETNGMIIAELESLARTVYDYWFTQFDFPDEHGNPYRSSGGRMVHDPTLNRDIPEGWQVTSLGELCTFRNGINYSRKDDNSANPKYYIINVRDISSSSLLLNPAKLDIVHLNPSKAERYRARVNDLVIARSGVPGFARILPAAFSPIIFCGFIIAATPNNNMLRNFLLMQLKQYEGSNVTKTGGSILQNVSQDTLGRLKICIPPQEIIQQFNPITDYLLKGISKAAQESAHLTALRDRLLPLLMSGQAVGGR